MTVCLYHEKDGTFSRGLQASERKQYLFIFYLDISNQSKELVVLTPHVDGIDTTTSHCGTISTLRAEVMNFTTLNWSCARWII